MNVMGLIFTLNGVSGVLNSPFYDGVRGVKPSELATTRKAAAQMIKVLQAAPPDKLSAMVAKYDDQLTRALTAFQSDWAANRLQGFKDAEIMIGVVTTVMAKSGLRG